MQVSGFVDDHPIQRCDVDGQQVYPAAVEGMDLVLGLVGPHALEVHDPALVVPASGCRGLDLDPEQLSILGQDDVVG